ncbi:CHASE2 domain-containing protein [Nitrospira sp. Nam80]
MAHRWLNRTIAIHRIGNILGLSITTLMLVLGWFDLTFLTRLENISLDYRFRLRGERPLGEEIVLVVIDDKSLRELGRWPWSRNTQARLVTAIAAQGAKVIGVDIIYAEPEIAEASRDLQELIAKVKTASSLPAAWLGLLERRLGAADSDASFVKSVRDARNVVLGFPFFVRDRSSIQQELPHRTGIAPVIRRSEFMLVRQSAESDAMEPYRATDALLPLEAFAAQAVGLGHVSSLPDLDGTTRAEYLALRYEDSYYPSFALEISRIFLDLPKDRMSLILGEGVHLGDRVIVTDQKARMFINFAGREGSFPFISATDVIHRRIMPEAFKDKVVLVGTAALATYDHHITPFSANFAGVEKNATVVENVIHQRFIRRSLWFGPLELGMILLCGLTVTFCLQRLRALPGTALVVTVSVCYAAITQYVFAAHNIWLPLLNPMLTIACTFMALTIVNFATKEKQAKEIRRMFSSYVSPRIVEELIASPSRAALGGQRRELTMLFADIIDFTSFSEKHSAEEVVAQLNEYLKAMTEVVFRWHGTLDKFVGDAIVVFWGAPLDQSDHAELAIKCALHMRKRLNELREKWTAEGKVLLDNGIGINTGIAVVGNIGAEGKKVDYTMIGDQVNLASRFQGLTRKFGASIVVTEYTAARLKEMMTVEERPDNRGRLGHVMLRKLGTVRVTGREEPVGAYTVKSLALGEQSRIEEMPALSTDMDHK